MTACVSAWIGDIGHLLIGVAAIISAVRASQTLAHTRTLLQRSERRRKPRIPSP